MLRAECAREEDERLIARRDAHLLDLPDDDPVIAGWMLGDDLALKGGEGVREQRHAATPKIPLEIGEPVRTGRSYGWCPPTEAAARQRHPARSERADLPAWLCTVERLTVQRMDHVGIVVDDLAAATEFFVQLGLELLGEAQVEGRSVDRIVGLEGVRTEVAFVQTPDGHGRLELIKFHTPAAQGDNRRAPANTLGLRHITFAVEDIDAVVARLRAHGAELVGELERYENSYRLCYVRGPEGIIVELAEKIG
jgi:catechol 2,3-dioxygenase-like lactoylglutathione lyase family enzyme